jgi:hypothetical protein
MIEKCAISNINNNMQFIGLIILLLILCIVLLYYIKISSKTHNEIIEKYNNGSIPSSVNKSPYLNTSGRSPELQNTSDGHKDARYPTSNNAKISTATLRPCQIHFNDDGTSKYIYEDEWKEFNTLISDEDGTVYNVPYKKFSNDNNNVKDFINFNETTKCFKKKDSFNDSLNTYNYKSNDLIKYRLDTYIEINVEENNKYDKKLFMQMNFDKHPSNVHPGKYKENVLDSICSYNYNKDLTLGNIKLYRIKIVPKTGITENINDSLITSIDYVTIKPVNNSEFIISSENETKNELPELLVSNSTFYNIENNGDIRYEIRKNQPYGDAINGINVKVYKFNRNLDCDDNAIKSYETTDMRFKSEELISVTNYISEIINNGNPFPSDIHISNIQDIIDKDELSGKVINGISREVITNSLNLVIKKSYETKDEFLQAIYYFICKLIVYSNQQIVTDVITLINNNAIQTSIKKIFVDSFDTFSKFITLYQANTFDDIRKKQIFTEIANDKFILNNAIFSYNYESVQIVKFNKIPFDLENVYEVKIYTIDSIDKTLTLPEDTFCDILLVGGGGGGGKNAACEGGGGGGGGTVIHLTNFKLRSNTTYKFEIGRGGDKASGAHNNTIYGGNGGNTKISTFNNAEYIIAKGGGGGGPGTPEKGSWAVNNTNNGGSGGGGSSFGGGGGGGFFAGIEHNIGNLLSYKQYGNNGGNANNAGGGGGGGGAGSSGGSPNGNNGGNGGDGINIPFIDDNYYGAGGGGSTGNSCQGDWAARTGFNAGTGGKGGGGNGGRRADTIGIDGKQHTGSGGGGASYTEAGNGGSGIIIIKYLKRPTVVNDSRGELTINPVKSNIFKDGLYFKIFDGYYGSVDWPVGWHHSNAPDNLNYTKDGNGKPKTSNRSGNNNISSGIVTNILNLVDGTNNAIGAENTNNWERYTVEWQGYFYAQKTGTYHFHTASDDASHLWIGDGAYTLDKNSITVNNGGLHGRHGVTGSIYLNEGIYYPMRILFGENGGGDNMTVYFHPPGDTWITNGYGWYYHIPESKDITSDYIVNFNLKDTLFPKLIIKDRDTNIKINDNFSLKLLKEAKYLISSFLNKIHIFQEDINYIKEFKHSGNNENQTTHSIQFEKDAICDILIVAGGGGGGMDMGGGGGGGGVIELTNFTVKAGTYNITVGKGGNGAPAGGTNKQPTRHEFNIGATQGFNSSFGIYTAVGGGYGGSSYQDHYLKGQGGNGGSGGGSSGYCYNENSSRAGQGTAGQGNRGGYSAGAWYGAGGGGAGEVGGGPSTQAGGARGGNGKLSNILGTQYYWGGGGGGSSYSTSGGDGGLGGGGGGAVGTTKGGLGYNNGSPGGGGVPGTLTNSPGGNGGPHTGGGGGGGSHYNMNNKGGDGGSGIVIIKLKGYTVYETRNDNIKITYDIDDDSAINLKNAQDNKKLIINTNNYIEQINPNVYKIGTKIEEEHYKKFLIIIHSLTVGNITFEKGRNSGIISTNDYEITVVTDNSSDIKITNISVIFYKNVIGDIYMKLSGYSNVFIYNTNNDPNKDLTKPTIDISRDFRDYLAVKIPSKDSNINTIFGLDTYNRDVQTKINNRTSVTINANSSLQISGIKNDITKDKLEKLQNIYNSVKNFDAQSSSRRPTITVDNTKKIIDIMPTFNTNIVSYENPTDKHPNTYGSTYNIQDVSNNYIYFRYPNQ